MRTILTVALPLAIVASCLNIYKSSFLSWKQEDVVADSPRQLDNSVSRARKGMVAKGGFLVLPKRLITVFGLESSGTSLMATTLAEAVGAQLVEITEDLIYRTKKQGNIEIQHVSQPWGFFHEDNLDNRTVFDIEFLPPFDCMVWPHYLPYLQKEEDLKPPHSYCSREAGLDQRVRLPQRFMVNITSHVRWYRERGVEATAVVMVRDDYARLHGKVLTHNENLTHALQEDLHAKQLIADAMRQLSSLPVNGNGRSPELIVVSYEALMSLQKPYLFDLYTRLGIRSTYMPELENGNKKYIQPLNGTEDWEEDDPGKLIVA